MRIIQMMNMYKYLFLFFIALALPDSAEAGKNASVPQNDSEIHQAGSHLESAIYPRSKAVFYGYQIPAEKRVQTQNRLSETNAVDEKEHDRDHYETADVSANQKVYSEFVHRLDRISRSQSPTKLLFPFHFHL